MSKLKHLTIGQPRNHHNSKRSPKLTVVSQSKCCKPTNSYTSPAISPSNPISICVETTARLLLMEPSQGEQTIKHSYNHQTEFPSIDKTSQYLPDVYPHKQSSRIKHSLMQKKFQPITFSTNNKHLQTEQTQYQYPQQEQPINNFNKQYYNNEQINSHKKSIDYSTEQPKSPMHNEIRYFSKVEKLQHPKDHHININKQFNQQDKQHKEASIFSKGDKQCITSEKDILHRYTSVKERPFKKKVKYQQQVDLQVYQQKQFYDNISIHEDEVSEPIGQEVREIIQINNSEVYQENPTNIQQHYGAHKKQNASLCANISYKQHSKQQKTPHTHSKHIKQTKRAKKTQRKPIEEQQQADAKINDTFIKNKNKYLHHLKYRQQQNKFLHRRTLSSTSQHNRSKSQRPLSLKCRQLVNRLYTDPVKNIGTVCVRYERSMRMKNMDMMNKLINEYPLLRNNLLSRERVDLFNFLSHAQISYTLWPQKLIDYVNKKLAYLKKRSI